jgi:hypothetical protein
MSRYGTLILAVLAVLPVAAQAQTSGPALRDAISAEELGAVVQAVTADYELETTIEYEVPDPQTRLVLVEAGLRFSFVLYGCDEAGQCPVVTAFATFQGPSTADEMNAWNRGARFSRAYVDEEADAVIEDDLLLAGGVTGESVRLYVNSFLVSLAEFADFLAPEEEPEGTATPDDGGR